MNNNHVFRFSYVPLKWPHGPQGNCQTHLCSLMNWLLLSMTLHRPEELRKTQPYWSTHVRVHVTKGKMRNLPSWIIQSSTGWTGNDSGPHRPDSGTVWPCQGGLIGMNSWSFCYCSLISNCIFSQKIYIFIHRCENRNSIIDRRLIQAFDWSTHLSITSNDKLIVFCFFTVWPNC